MSKRIFGYLSKALLIHLTGLSNLINQIFMTEPNLLVLLHETPFNLEHILELLNLSNQVDQLMINLFLGHNKDSLQQNSENDKRIFMVFQKMNFMVLMTQQAFSIPVENRTSDTVAFLETLVESCRILIYEFSCLQKVIPLFFTSFLKEYIQMAYNGLKENWESTVVLKSFCFMFLKILKTYVYYRGRARRVTPESGDSTVILLIRRNEQFSNRQKICNATFYEMINDKEVIHNVISSIFQLIMCKSEYSSGGGADQTRPITWPTSTTRS